VNDPTPQDGKQLQQKITTLIESLENDVSSLKADHAKELQALTNRCRQDIQTLHLAFSSELDQVEINHQTKLNALVDEIAYLKEMSQSQRIMMESNLEYIRAMELRQSDPGRATKS
jgi:site-specific recombinase